MDNPKNTVLSSNINHHPGQSRCFVFLGKNDFVLAREEDCAQHG